MHTINEKIKKKYLQNENTNQICSIQEQIRKNDYVSINFNEYNQMKQLKY